MAKQYPKLNSTYFALVISCVNAGHTLGYAIGALLLIFFSTMFTEFWIIFFLIMLIMAGFQMASFLIFITIDPKEYEFSHHLDKG